MHDRRLTSLFGAFLILVGTGLCWETASAAIQVSRDMLQGKYDWQAIEGDSPRAIKMDAALFNRHEGYEVIPMIQKVVNHFDYDSEADVRKVEDLILNELPGSVRGKKRVLQWLVERLGN